MHTWKVKTDTGEWNNSHAVNFISLEWDNQLRDLAIDEPQVKILQ